MQGPFNFSAITGYYWKFLDILIVCFLVNCGLGNVSGFAAL